MKLINKKKLLEKSSFTFSLLMIVFLYGSLNLLSKDNICYKKKDDLTNFEYLICKFSRYASKPSEFLIEGARQSKYLLKFKKLSGLIAYKAEQTINRFKNSNLKPGFNFYYPKYTKPNAGYLILSAADSQNKGYPLIEIWDMNAQKKVHTYKFNYKELLKNIKGNKGRYRLIHPLLLNDGSIIVNNFGGGQYLMKFDKCGNLINYIDKYKSHHSLEIDKNGDIYTPIYLKRKDISNNQELHPIDFFYDGFLIVDKNLNIKKTFSLLEIYEKNNLTIDIYGNQRLINDPFHLNDVQPFITKNGEKYVLLSLKGHSRVLALKLEDLKISWLIDRATSLQHDVDIIYSKENTLDISIFDNNTRTFGHGISSLKNFDNKIAYFKNLPLKIEDDLISISDKKTFRKYKLNYEEFDFINYDLVPKTRTEGLSDHLLKNNSLMVEETNYGRLMEIDMNDKKILWQYYNKTKGQPPYMMNWSRRIEKLPEGLNLSIFQKCKFE